MNKTNWCARFACQNEIWRMAVNWHQNEWIQFNRCWRKWGHFQHIDRLSTNMHDTCLHVLAWQSFVLTSFARLMELFTRRISAKRILIKPFPLQNENNAQVLKHFTSRVYLYRYCYHSFNNNSCPFWSSALRRNSGKRTFCSPFENDDNTVRWQCT